MMHVFVWDVPDSNSVPFISSIDSVGLSASAAREDKGTLPVESSAHLMSYQDTKRSDALMITF